MKMTMKEIAKLANVSQPTVSRVINGNPNVDKALAKRVMKVIEESNYTVNRAAQTLKNSQSYLIGVSFSDLSNPYFIEVLNALEEATRKEGYNIIIHNSAFNPLQEWQNIQNFMSRQVDGILMIPTSDYNMDRFKDLNVPMVITTQIKDGFDSVSVDHDEGVRLIADHLISEGHRKIGYIGPPVDFKLDSLRAALYDNGIPLDESRIIPLTSNEQSTYAIHEDIKNFIKDKDSFDCSAVFCYNDVTALEFIRLQDELEVNPFAEDLAIVGFDDTMLSKIFQISSVHQPIQEMTEIAFKLLLSRIENPEKAKTKIELPPKLIVRKSSIK